MILSKEQYSNNMKNLLEDDSTYSRLLNNPMFKYRNALEQVVHFGLKKNILKKRSQIPNNRLLSYTNYIFATQNT